MVLLAFWAATFPTSRQPRRIVQMSAVAVFVNSQRAVILTDSAIYDYKGIPIAFDRKIFPVESWNGAITFRGDAYGIGFAMALCERFASFDDFIARSAPAIEHMYRHEIAGPTDDNGRLIEVHAIGWSEAADQPRAYVLKSPTSDDDGPPFVWRSLDEEDGVFYTRLSALENWRLHRQGAEPDVDVTAETFDPSRHAIPLMEAMRRGTCDAKFTPGAAGKHVVGGEVWMTVVDRDGTREDVIHTWETDRVGVAIQPARFDDDAAPQIAPEGCPWPFDRFERLFKGGAIDPETFALNKPRMEVIEAAHSARAKAAHLPRRERAAVEARIKKALARV
ncbi:MAG: hypothetical protein INR68_18840 [Methylobacterium mesophilicum]|nr:hypothetical protein [Methylobacterium mesophilicum]